VVAYYSLRVSSRSKDSVSKVVKEKNRPKNGVREGLKKFVESLYRLEGRVRGRKAKRKGGVKDREEHFIWSGLRR